MQEVHASHMILQNKTFIKVTWDPSAGRQVLRPRKGLMGTLKTWVLGKETAPEGEIKWSFPSGLNILFPKYTDCLANTSELEEFNITTVDYIWRRYGVVVPGEVIEPELSSMLGIGGGQDNGNSSEAGTPVTEGKLRHVLLKERWIRPCEQYQKGAIFTWAGDELLRASNLLDFYPDIPFVDATMITDDKDIMGTSILWDLIPLQKLMNRALSAADRWLKMISLLRLWVPSSTGIKEEDLNNITGMAVLIDGKDTPEWDKPPELNETIFRIIDTVRGLISSYGYANELAKRGATSGNALGILQEMDDTIFKPGLLSLQSMYSRACRLTIQLAARYIDTPRMVLATSMQGWQITQFKGDMMNDDFHVEVNLMTGLPTNKAMRLEFLTGLFKNGILTRDEVKNNLEFGTDNEALEKLQKQNEIVEARVESILDFPTNYVRVPDPENGELTWDYKYPYNVYDNHPLMIERLQTTLQESGEHVEPYVKLALLDQWKAAKDMLEKQLAKQQAMQAASAEAPAGEEAAPAEAGALPEESLAPDSNQVSEDQPPEGQIPPPLNTGA